MMHARAILRVDILLMIEILHDLICQNHRSYGSNYSKQYILGDAGFLSSAAGFDIGSIFWDLRNHVIWV